MIVDFCPGPPTIASVFISTPGDRDTRDYAEHVILREAHAQEEEGGLEEGFPAALPEGVKPMVSTARDDPDRQDASSSTSCPAGSSPLQVSAYRWNGGRCPLFDSGKLNWCPRWVRAFKKWNRLLRRWPGVCCCRHPLVYGVPALEEVCCDISPAFCHSVSKY